MESEALRSIQEGAKPAVEALEPLLSPLLTFSRDERGYWLAGGLVLGGYFGFRLGVVSGRAQQWVTSKRYTKAAALNSYQGFKAVSVQSVEVPELVTDTEVLIEVRAASLDPVDLKVSHGFGRGLRELVNRYNPHVNSFPVILGRDGTGVVTEVGREVHSLKPGDRVWFVVPHCVQGSLTGVLLLDSQYVRPLPDGLSFEAGATLPYCGMQAWHMLVTSGGLGPGERSRGKSVLVWGGVRALERLTVQLCAHWGCSVTCVAPLYTHEYLQSLGATSLITDDMAELGKVAAAGTRYDVVVNTSGLLAEELCLALTAPEGRVVTALVAPPGLRECGLATSLLSWLVGSITSLLRDNLWGGHRDWKTTQLSGEVLDYLGELVSKGVIYPVGEKIYPLEQAELALQSLAAGGHKGKLVIRMEEESRLCLQG